MSKKQPQKYYSVKHTKSCPCNSASLPEQIKQFLPELKSLASLNPKEKKTAIKKLSPCLTKFVSSCSGALLRKDIELPEEKYKDLKEHKNLLLFLNNKKNSLKKKKEAILSKKGGIFPFIPVLASVLGPILGKVIADNI